MFNTPWQLKKSLIADYVVLGGGNAKELKEIPKGVELDITGTRSWAEPDWQLTAHTATEAADSLRRKNVKRVTTLKWTVINAFFLLTL